MPALSNPTSSLRPPEPDQDPDADKKSLDLSVTQLAGGALAAMTAAYLGSRFSVAGTVIGAAIASIIAGVGGAVYTASLRHTRDKVKSVWTGRVNGTPAEVVVTSAAAPLWRTGRFWKRVLIGVIAVFAITVGTITGLELVSGQALSGGQGTTVERVRQPQPAADETSEAPSDEPSEKPSAEPSASPSEEPTQDPTQDSTQDPTQGSSESASDEPTEPKTEEPTEQQSQPTDDEPSSASTGEATEEPDAPSAGPTVG